MSLIREIVATKWSCCHTCDSSYPTLEGPDLFGSRTDVVRRMASTLRLPWNQKR